MKILLAASALALLLAAPAVAAPPSAAITAAVADAHRPPEDKARDAARHPAELLAFAGVRPGDRVLEVLPGGGYFTRILAKAVAPGGHVYAAVPTGGGPDAGQGAAVTKIAADPAYADVSVIDISPAGYQAAGPVDVMFTSQNYHDFHLSRLKLDVAQTDKLLFSAVKPGGVLLLVDHVAATGAPVGPTADALHRIDPAVARAELEAAGFVFDGESQVLRNPADPHDKIVFDPSIRSHTDQFVYRFRKPK